MVMPKTSSCWMKPVRPPAMTSPLKSHTVVLGLFFPGIHDDASRFIIWMSTGLRAHALSFSSICGVVPKLLMSFARGVWIVVILKPAG